MSNLDSWFRELFQPLRTSARSAHPSRTVLYKYFRGQLPDTWRIPTHLLDVNDWTLTEVSQHVLTCRSCAQQLALLRRDVLKPSWWTELKYILPREIQAHLAIYALALLALLGLNAILVFVVPAPMVVVPCLAPGERAGPAQPADPEFPEGSLKFEGFSKLVRCMPVPAPRPLWQTWWVGWVFLFWTMLLALHILWEWLTTLAPRRPVATSALAIALCWIIESVLR